MPEDADMSARLVVVAAGVCAKATVAINADAAAPAMRYIANHLFSPVRE
jgi:hypothetical protein